MNSSTLECEMWTFGGRDYQNKMDRLVGNKPISFDDEVMILFSHLLRQDEELEDSRRYWEAYYSKIPL